MDRSKPLAVTSSLGLFAAWVAGFSLVACVWVSAPEFLAFLGGRFGIDESSIFYLGLVVGNWLVLAAFLTGVVLLIHGARRAGGWRPFRARSAALAAALGLGVGLALAVTQFLPDRDDVRLMGIYERVKKNVDPHEVRAWMRERAVNRASEPKCPPSLLSFYHDEDRPEFWLREDDGVICLRLSGAGADLWDSGILFTSEPANTPPPEHPFFSRDFQILWLVRPGVWLYEGFRYPLYEDDWE